MGRECKAAHVLVVDDDRDIRETLRFVFEDAGYEVLEASDGAAALQVLRASRRGLVVVLDLNMPGMDGMEVLRTVAAEAPLAARHAILVLSANNKTLPLAFVHLLVELDVPVMAKPFDVDALLLLVETSARRLCERDGH